MSELIIFDCTIPLTTQELSHLPVAVTSAVTVINFSLCQVMRL